MKKKIISFVLMTAIAAFGIGTMSVSARNYQSDYPVAGDVTCYNYSANASTWACNGQGGVNVHLLFKGYSNWSAPIYKNGWGSGYNSAYTSVGVDDTQYSLRCSEAWGYHSGTVNGYNRSFTSYDTYHIWNK